ncbi:hypothetical protein N9872_00665 [Paraglaciecola sp.]|nr:hypothetical protein [Paraglaciecola sp.]
MSPPRVFVINLTCFIVRTNFIHQNLFNGQPLSQEKQRNSRKISDRKFHIGLPFGFYWEKYSQRALGAQQLIFTRSTQNWIAKVVPYLVYQSYINFKEPNYDEHAPISFNCWED